MADKAFKNIKIGGKRGVALPAVLGLGAGVALWLMLSRMFPTLGALARGRMQ